MLVHRRLLRIAGDIRGDVAVGVAIGLLICACYIVQGVLVAHVLAGVFDGAGVDALAGALGAIAAIMLARAALSWAAELSGQRTAHAVKLRLRGRLYARLLALGPGHLARGRTGDVQSTLVDGVEALEAYYGRYLPAVATCLIGPPLIVAYLATLDVWIAAIVAVFALGVPTLPRLWDRVVAREGEARWQAYRHLNATYLDSMQGIATLKAFGAAASRRAELEQASRRLYATTMRQLGVSMFDTAITTFGVLAGASAAVAVGAVRTADGQLDLQLLFVVLMLSRECFRPFGELTRYWHAGYQGISSSEQIAALLDSVAPVTEPQRPATHSRPQPHIVFDAVTFAYQERSRPAVRNLSLELVPHSTVAVVGESGAGKTTIVSLLLRFFDPAEGRILLGGHDLRELPLETVRAMIAVVAQDTYLFTGSIADNLRLARPDASDAQLHAAAQLARAHEFIAALPDGYGTQVSERGLNLSGGQRQRIAIARALLKDAPILVLDEATSSVDPRSERAIRAGLERLRAGRTTLIIAHRLSTIRGADRIVVLADGEVAESGTHHELLAREAGYARLVAAQQLGAA